MKGQILRESRDEVVDGSQFSMTFDQNVSLSQSSPRQRQFLLETFGTKNLAQRQQAFPDSFTLRR